LYGGLSKAAKEVEKRPFGTPPDTAFTTNDCFLRFVEKEEGPILLPLFCDERRLWVCHRVETRFMLLLLLLMMMLLLCGVKTVPPTLLMTTKRRKATFTKSIIILIRRKEEEEQQKEQQMS